MKRWYAVHTKAGQERIAEGNLLRQGYESYLPRLAGKRKGARGRAGDIVRPLFPGYLFVALDIERTAWGAINSTYGVAYLVSFGGRPAALPDHVIPEIRAREAEDGLIRESSLRRFRAGERVEIADGPFAESDALFQAADGARRVIVLMSMLGRRVPIRLSEDRIRAAS